MGAAWFPRLSPRCPCWVSNSTWPEHPPRQEPVAASSEMNALGRPTTVQYPAPQHQRATARPYRRVEVNEPKCERDCQRERPRRRSSHCWASTPHGQRTVGQSDIRANGSTRDPGENRDASRASCAILSSGGVLGEDRHKLLWSRRFDCAAPPFSASLVCDTGVGPMRRRQVALRDPVTGCTGTSGTSSGRP